MALWKMNKHEQKLIKYQNKAQNCTSRKEAQEILRKHTKARAKVYVKHVLDND